MRGIFWLLFLISWGVLAGARLAGAQTVGAVLEAVQFLAQDGGFLVTSAEYQARIGSDGNLRSLAVNGVEMLDDKIAGSLGASFFFEQPITLGPPVQDRQDITAKNDLYAIRYHFEPGYIKVTLKHANPKGAAYVAVCSQKIAFIEDLDTTTVATAPVEYQWGDVRMTTASGEYLHFREGSRVWGREINRQVWEYSSLAPDRDYSFMLTPGQGKPLDPPLDHLTTMKLTMNRSDQLIPGGEPVALQVRFDNNSNNLVTTEMTMSVEASTGKVLLNRDQKPLVCEPHKSVTLTWTVTPPEADFYRVNCSAIVGNARKAVNTTFGYDVAAIRPEVKRPDDFSRYWARIVAEAKAVDWTITQIPNQGLSNSRVKVSEVRIEENGVRLFSGWLSVPTYQGRYPALLVLPADRATMLVATPNMAERSRCVVFGIDPTNQENIRAALRPMIDIAMQKQSLVNKDTFGMRAMMVRCLLAVSVLAAMKEVDPDRIAVTGYGLGGGMALILAALDERIQAVAPDVPYFCNIPLRSTRPDWPYLEVAEFLKANPAQRDLVMATLSYYDVANFADLITCPVLISAGINDLYSRPENIVGVANLIPGPRSLMFYLAGHEGGTPKHQYVKIDWLKKILGGPGPEWQPVVVPEAPVEPPPDVAPPVAEPTAAPAPAAGDAAP